MTLVATMTITDDIPDQTREALWMVVATGSIPFLTTNENTEMQDDRWFIMTCDEGAKPSDPQIVSELATLVGCAMREDVRGKVLFHDAGGKTILPNA